MTADELYVDPRAMARLSLHQVSSREISVMRSESAMESKAIEGPMLDCGELTAAHGPAVRANGPGFLSPAQRGGRWPGLRDCGALGLGKSEVHILCL
jgi:hypothetical protein